MFHVFRFLFMLKQLLFLALLTEFALTLSDFPFLLLRRQVFEGLFFLSLL